MVEAAVAGSIVTIPWPAGLDAGAYEVAYRVASGDGHPVTGTVPFSYTGPTNPASTFAATPTAALTPAPVPSGAPTPEPTRTAPNLFIIGGLLVAAALVGGIVIVRRGRQ